LIDFLIDNNLPIDLVDWLGQRDLAAEHVKNVDLERASDFEVWKHALSQNLAIITKDKDFERFATQSKVASRPVFRLVLGNATKLQLFVWLEPRVHVFRDFARLAKDVKYVHEARVVLVD
jgi:predicted nuclease of predicted toxin-antitoxin system